MSKYKGRVLVINAFEFKRKDKTRWHSKKDDLNLKPLFIDLGFQVIIRTLSYREVRNLILV